MATATFAAALGLTRHAQHGLLECDSVGSVLGVWGCDPKGTLASYSASFSGTPLFGTSCVRDSLGRITELTETVQSVTTVQAFTYDSVGRLATVRRNGDLTASYRYDLNGNRLDVTTRNGVVAGTYDARDRLLTYGTASYSYTRNGELLTKTDAGGTTTYTYDALGNLVQVTLPGGSPSSGRLTSVTDPLGNVTQFDYDSAGHVTRQTRPDGEDILFGYDRAGNLTNLTPPGRPAHGVQYAPVGFALGRGRAPAG